MAAVAEGEEVKLLLAQLFTTRMKRSMPTEGVRRLLAFSDHVCSWHEEQLTLAEYSAFVIRDIIAHVELAAEARVKQSPKKAEDAETDDDSEAETAGTRRNAELELVDVGGGLLGDVEEDEGDLAPTECSAFPLTDHAEAIALALQQDAFPKINARTVSYTHLTLPTKRIV